MIVKFCGFKTESDIKKIKKLEKDAIGKADYILVVVENKQKK